MSDTEKTKNANKLDEFIGTAQARLSALEADARKAVTEFVDRGEKLTRAELETLVARLEKSEALQRAKALWQRRSELGDKAESVRHEAIRRLDAVSQKALAAISVATREQVSAIAKDLEELGKRLEKLVGREDKPTTPPTA